ncbi:hypothetical protein K5D43_25010 [Pseudomonas cichorii]|nr:hypothetical protein [Pseudomonas cichorii]
MQRNSSGMASGTSEPAQGKKPAAKDSTVATQGTDGASGTASQKSDQTKLGARSLHDMTNEGLGVSGEHIADYICAMEFGWGRDWDGHDKGADGKWLEGLPSANKLGKLSKGGSPKVRHALYKLTDGANGTGIDAVWCANPDTNDGKNFAIVEAKASRDEDGPKFMRKPNNTRKPGVASTLGVSGITDPSELLEPLGTDLSAPKGKKTGKLSRSKSSPATADKKSKAAKQPKEILVQMSKEWIRANIESAVPKKMVYQVLGSYSRHLFYTPLYHPGNSPKEHAYARLNNGDESTHANHSAFHYPDSEVRLFVNKRKRSLALKYEGSTSLAIEE